MFMEWKTRHCQMSVFPNMIYRFSAISVIYFVDINKLIIKFVWRGKGPKIVKKILKENNKVGGLTLPDFKPYYKETIIRTV